MKAFLLTCGFILTSAIAAPVSENEAKIIQFSNTSNGKGNYEFSYETSNGISRSEIGTLVNAGQPDEYIEVQGSYSYTDPDGNIINVNYTADKNGYQIIKIVPFVYNSAPLPPNLVASLIGG